MRASRKLRKSENRHKIVGNPNEYEHKLFWFLFINVFVCRFLKNYVNKKTLHNGPFLNVFDLTKVIIPQEISVIFIPIFEIGISRQFKFSRNLSRLVKNLLN